MSGFSGSRFGGGNASFGSLTGDPTDNDALALALQGYPIVLSAKNITVLTSGAPADIASISLPSWFTRGCIQFATSGAVSSSRIIMETGAATLGAGAITLFTASNGGGTAISTSQTLPTTTLTSVGVFVSATGGNVIGPSTVYGNNTIYIRQTANSANAGTISVYLVLMPFL